MQSRDFAFWLQGFFEIANPEAMSADQTEMVKRHLALVFVHEIDPSMGGEKHQANLNATHAAPTMTIKPHTPQPIIHQVNPNDILFRC